jgi:hypothetical protein
MTSALWSHARPPQAVLDAYAHDPQLGAMRLEFAATIEDSLITLAIGLSARGRASGGLVHVDLASTARPGPMIAVDGDDTSAVGAVPSNAQAS